MKEWSEPFEVRAVMRAARERAMDTKAPETVIVIDDDPVVRTALARLLRSVGLQVTLHGSVAEFLQSSRPDGPSCMILDVRLPGKGGLDFQRDLASAGVHIPIIFLTGHGDIAMSVEAMKGGAIEFLTKPFRDQDLINAVQIGLDKSRIQQEKTEAHAVLQGRFNSLSHREREVLALVVAGNPNKIIADQLGVSEITVKFHRGNVMRKMAAASLADLVLMAAELKALSNSGA